ncbi:glycosyltransferase family 2 protein [Rhodococcus rhodnii]|uniref:Glycosyltransferase n=1 Tax=Rhodococcus rhodnii LMG 5362 TaxID=1273125 RepID=R7WK09_9NOCA|nr:glycosyltransferase family 2 protein [Rhodococcus rhodnii]EOM75642.1 glycosyltransferase [Rhodococcus rhodnii LMG 5362]
MTPSLDVVVCCYTTERDALLVRSIDSARTQLGDADRLVVVVDHNDTLASDLHERGIATVANSGPRGLSGARNTGLENARGDVVVFLDDDAALRPGALDAVRRAFADPDVVAIGGAVHADWESSRPAWFPPEFGWVVGCDYRGLPDDGATIRNPIGAAMAVRRDALVAVGGFSSELGRVGTVPAGCEETLMGIELTAHDARTRIVRVTDFAVDHAVPESRATWRYFTSRCRHEGRSKAILSSITGPGAGLSSERTYVTRTLPSGVLHAVRDAARARSVAPLARVVALALGLVATAAGLLTTRRRRATPSRAVTATPIRADELVSVVIATVGRDSLAHAVHSVLDQKHREFELLVVDNRCDGNVDRVVGGIDDPRLRILRQPVPGVSAARNLGVAAAHGRIVAFTDDDATPEIDWLDRILATFAADTHGRLAGVTGRVLGTESGTREQRWFEDAGVFDKGTTATVWAMRDAGDLGGLGRFGEHGPFFPFTAGECGTGNNMAFRTDALREIGGFDEHLGTGTPAHGGEDLDLYRTALLAGWAIAYAPDAVVRHYHRDNLADLRVQSYGYGTGMAASLTKLAFTGPRHTFDLVRRFPRGLHMLLSPNSTKNENVPTDWPVHLRLLEVWGYLVGPVLYARSRVRAGRARTRS